MGPNSTAVRRSREFVAGIFFVHLNYVVGHLKSILQTRHFLCLKVLAYHVQVVHLKPCAETAQKSYHRDHIHCCPKGYACNLDDVKCHRVGGSGRSPNQSFSMTALSIWIFLFFPNESILM